MRMLRLLSIAAALLAVTVIGIAQTSEPTPLTIPTQPIPTQPAPAPAEVAREQAELAADIKELQELTAENAEILKQQQAALDQLDDLQKEAEQLRIFSKRG